MGADCSNQENEKKWLEGLVRGDAASFNVLYDQYGHPLHAHLLRMLKSEEAAKEVFQDVFMKVWEHRQRIDPDRPFGAYLYRIAENRVFDHFRKLAREKRMSDHLATTLLTSHTEPENDPDHQDRFRLLQQAIGQLPPVRQRVYRLSKVDGKSYDEIAALLGVSTATVNDHIVKANRFLRSYLVRYLDIVLAWVVWMWA